MFNDSQQVFDVIKRGKRPTERRLAIDVSAAREEYKSFAIERVGLVRGEDNPADAASKPNGNSSLEKILRSNVDDTIMQEWIVRTEARK